MSTKKDQKGITCAISGVQILEEDFSAIIHVPHLINPHQLHHTRGKGSIQGLFYGVIEIKENSPLFDYFLEKYKHSHMTCSFPAQTSHLTPHHSSCTPWASLAFLHNRPCPKHRVDILMSYCLPSLTWSHITHHLQSYTEQNPSHHFSHIFF